MKPLHEHYAVLGLLPSAEVAVLEAAYEALSRRYQSEDSEGGSTESRRKLRQLDEAYQAIHQSLGFSNNANGPSRDRDWAFATEYYPDLLQTILHLERISHQLALEYRSRLLESRDLRSRHELAGQLENEYFIRLFGRSEKLVRFARELVERGNRAAAEELSLAVNLLGGDTDPDTIIARIRGKYFLIQTSEGESCSEQSLGILRRAIESGYTMTIDDKNVIKLTKNTGESYLYSNEHIIRIGQILGFSP